MLSIECYTWFVVVSSEHVLPETTVDYSLTSQLLTAVKIKLLGYIAIKFIVPTLGLYALNVNVYNDDTDFAELGLTV